MHKIKQIRSNHSSKVAIHRQKVKDIGLFNGIKVSNPATNGTQDFNEHWLTSTTNSHPEQVKEAEKILEVLEARHDPVKYEELKSKLNYKTTTALEVTIKANNIIVPHANSVDITALVQKHSLTQDAAGIHMSAIKWETGEHYLTKITSIHPLYTQFGYAIKTYNASEENDQYSFDAYLPSLNLDGMLMLRSMPFYSNVPGVQPMEKAKNIAHHIADSKVSFTFNDHRYNELTKKTLVDYTGAVGQEAIIKHNEEMQKIEDTAYQINDLNIGTEKTAEAEEKVVNSSSNLLDEKLKLINGTELEVKTILEHLLDPDFITDVLRDISPESYQQLKKCIFSALKSANAKEAFEFITSLGNPDLIDDWLAPETYDDNTVVFTGATTALYNFKEEMQRIEDTADQINDLNIDTEEPTEAEEKIINSTSNLLGEKLKLINGTELEIKPIQLCDPGFIKDVLRDISPESYPQLKKCIFSALKSINEKEAFEFITFLGDSDLVNEWLEREIYDNDTVDYIGATGFTAPYGFYSD